MKKMKSEKGITLVEAIVAMFLSFVAVASILSMQSSSMNTMVRSDYLSRAAGVLQEEMENRENQVMSQTLPSPPYVRIVSLPPLPYSGANTPTGLYTFNVVSTITPIALSNRVLINVRVTWQGSFLNSITSSVTASRQNGFNRNDTL